jgi:hypothetical protein
LKKFKFWKFKDSQFGSRRIKWHLGVGPMVRHKKYYKGEGGGFPQKSGSWWVLQVHVCMWLILAPKMLQPRTNHVATLALDPRPRQGVARLRAKRKTQQSHHMLPWMQNVWGNESSHSQMNSHCKSWSPKWTLEFSKHNFRGQNPSI